MNRRLRKKKRIGEFKERGFEVRAELRTGLGRAELDGFFDRFIGHVEGRDLSFGGSVGEVVEGFLTRNGRGSATEEDRAEVARFLEGEGDVVRHEVRALVDASHGWD